MAATYTKRSCSEFPEVLQRIREQDLLRKAGILSEHDDPDGIFRNHQIQRDHAFGILVIFESKPLMEKYMPEHNCCTSLEDVEALIMKLNSFPVTEKAFFTEKQLNYVNALHDYERKHKAASESAKERHRLEAAVKNAGKQREWLEKENTARVRRIQDMEREIRDYEAAIQRKLEAREGNTGEIRKVLDQSEPLVSTIRDDKNRLEEVTERLRVLKEEQTMKNRLLHPTATRLKALEAERLGNEQTTLLTRIEERTTELKSLEEQITHLEAKNANHAEEDRRLQKSLNRSKAQLLAAKNELDGGSRMVKNLNERSEALAARIAALGENDLRSIEERDNAYIVLLARAEELLNAWITSSKELRNILAVNGGVSAKELIEAIFFAFGPLCASGTTACEYLDAANAALEHLLLYKTDEERAGFWRIESFE